MAMKKTTTKGKQAGDAAIHADHPGGSVTTTDHDAIRAWAEARGGRPASVEGTGGGGDIGIIRLEFPDATNANDANLEEVDWDPFFEKFDASGLAMVYQEETAAGIPSNFNRFVKRETAAAKVARPTAKKTTAKPAAKKGTPVAKTTAKKTTSTAKKAAPAKPAAKTTAAKKTAAKKTTATSKKAPAAKKTAAKKTTAKTATAKKTTAKKVPAARGFRGR